MARTKKDTSFGLTAAFVAGLACVTVGCQPQAESQGTDARSAGGATGGGTASGGAHELGGSTGSGAGGGVGLHGGSAAGGTVGAGGATSGGRSGGGMQGSAGGQTSSSGPSASGGDAGQAGRIGSGGQVTSGGVAGQAGQNGSGGQADGGSVTKDGATDIDARDATVEHLQIPDLGSPTDATPAFWPAAYTTNCTPAAIGGRLQADGHHRPGEDCMRSGCHLNPRRAEHHAGTDCRGSGCHANGSPDGSGAPAFLFGGTVYRPGTLAATSGVQVGVRTSQAFYSGCSASNGNFWVMAASGSSVTWASAKVRLRNTNGEAPMMTAAAAGCNASACHVGSLKMTAP